MSRPARLSTRATALAAGAALLADVVLVAAMLPVRSGLGASTSGLVLVIPVVVGVALGGWLAGMLAVAIGFFSYDFFFIRPYATLAVSSYRDWTTLGVYVVVMLIVARVVIALQQARSQARRSRDDTRRLLEVSDLLIGDRPLGELLHAVVETVRQEFRLTSATVLLPDGDRLQVAAHAGAARPEQEAAGTTLPTDQATPMALAGRSGPRTLPLSTRERSIGVLLLAGPALSPVEQRLLATYANHAALAVERAQLREEVLRSQVLAQVDGWRRALLGSVAHDLRTPLASIKAALSDLGDNSVELSAADRRELLATAEEETDRLTRLVENLLDVYRIEAGTRRLVSETVAAQEVVDEALDAVRARLGERPVRVDVVAGLMLHVDRYLVVRVLVNLLDNAIRHTAPKTPVLLRGRAREGAVEVSVVDQGPGLAPERIAKLFSAQTEPPEAGPGPAGVGLAICRVFVDANGGTISAVAPANGGLAVTLRLPAAAG